MDYIEEMKDMRYAVHILSQKIPSFRTFLFLEANKYNSDEDLKIIKMTDLEFERLENIWQAVDLLILKKVERETI